MSEKQALYEAFAEKLADGGFVTESVEMLQMGTDQPAAVIDPPRTLKALRDSGLIEYRAWGWVKMSAKFIAHLKNLKGAKLAIWQCIALSIDDDGTCKTTIKQIGELTGYSHTEVIDSLKELEEMGYLAIDREGRGNIYQPVFVARGGNNPKESLVKKLDSTPADQLESSPARENLVSTFKRVKRVNGDNFPEPTPTKKQGDLVDGLLSLSQAPGIKRQARVDAILSALAERLHVRTTGRRWEDFAKLVDDRQQNFGEKLDVFLEWLVNQKGFNPQFWPPDRMGQFWPQAFVAPTTKPIEYYTPPKDEGEYISKEEAKRRGLAK